MWRASVGSSAMVRPWARQRSWKVATSRSGWRLTSTVSCSMRLEPLEPVAGVHVQRLAGDRLGEIAAEEEDGAGDLRAVREVAERGLGGRLGVALFEGDPALVGLVAEVGLDGLAPDVAGVDGVDPDAEATQLLGHGLG